VVGNLLDNAIRHGGGAGPITVTVSTTESDATLVVADRGPGVPPEELDRVFDRYFRSDQRRTSDGLGLGLAIARRVAELHGGSLSAVNAEPSGLVVTLSIPRPEAHSE
jgi:signal transduction histidine kinase